MNELKNMYLYMHFSVKRDPNKMREAFSKRVFFFFTFFSFLTSLLELEFLSGDF